MKKILITILSVIAAILAFGIYDINTKNIKAAEFERLNNNTILLTGEITAADKYRFDYQVSLLDNPNKFTLILNSPGGNAKGMFDLIESLNNKEIRTIVKPGSMCMSACAILWTFGSERLMYNGAKIGFHIASIGHVDYIKQLIDEYGHFGFQSLVQESFAYYIDFYSKLPVKDGVKLAFEIATKGYNSDNFFILSPSDVRNIIGGKYIN